MALNGNGNQALIDKRRELVARLVVRGLSRRDITDALGRQLVNPDTGGPFSLGTIHNDIKALEAEWQAEAQRDIQEHKARLLAELREVARQGWQAQNYELVLKTTAQIRALLGLDAPVKTDLTSGGESLTVLRVVYDDGIPGAPAPAASEAE